MKLIKIIYTFPIFDYHSYIFSKWNGKAQKLLKNLKIKIEIKEVTQYMPFINIHIHAIHIYYYFYFFRYLVTLLKKNYIK